jgi:copper transport protein
VLIRTEPGNDVVVPESPDQVLLEFHEPVDASLGSLRVFDGQGQEVDSGDVSQPVAKEVAVGLEAALPPGTYTVAWRVVSADSDPISGAFVFHVLERGVAATVSIGALTDTPQSVDVLFTAGRFFDLALILLAVGGSAALVVALPTAEWRVRRQLYGILAALAGALALVALENILLQGAAAGGLTLVDAFSWNLFTSVLDTRYGKVLIIQSGLAAALALTAFGVRHVASRDRRVLAALTLVLAAGLAVTPSFSGHASTLGALGLTSDVVHVVAASLWTGGLAFMLLGLLLARDDRWLLAMTCVPRFSTMAVVSVVALITAGIVSAYLQIRTRSRENRASPASPRPRGVQQPPRGAPVQVRNRVAARAAAFPPSEHGGARNPGVDHRRHGRAHQRRARPDRNGDGGHVRGGAPGNDRRRHACGARALRGHPAAR